MGALPTPEPTGLRYAPYIEQLREFFVFCGLPYGSPDNIFTVTEHLQKSSTFADDVASLVRSIVLSEGGSMPHAQLLEILALAIGGPEMEHTPQPYRQPLRELLGFITATLRRPWNQPPAERAEVVPFPSDPAVTPAEPARLRESPPPPSLEVRFEPPPAAEAVVRTPDPASPSPSMPKSNHAEPSAEPNPFAASWSTPPESKPTPWLSPSMREIMLAGAFAVLVAGLVAFALRPGSPLPSEVVPPVTSSQQATPASTADPQSELPIKPSAYGEAYIPNLVDSVPRWPSPQTTAALVAAPSRRYVDVASAVMAGKVVSAPAPSYPLMARIAHVRGPVEVRAVIDKDGTVAEARALRGHHLLRGAAVKAVRNWRFRPYELDGQPVDVSTTLTINFPTHS